MAHNGTAEGATEHKCCGISSREIQEKREARRNKKQPWIVLKLAVFLTIGIIAYAWYVYVGRLCVPMIRRDAGALGSRGLGIAFLVVFSILGLLMVWAYEKIVLTPPGYAKHHVQKSSPPVVRNVLPTWWESESEAELAAARFAPSQPPPPAPLSPSLPRPLSPRSSHRRSESRHKRDGTATRASEKPANGSANPRTHGSQNGHVRPPSLSTESPTTEENGGVVHTLPPPAITRPKAATDHSVMPTRPEMPPPGDKQAMRFTRSPPKTPVLREEYRYCRKDEFLKPLRAHHCRACGTCVLKYDHHCPWVGHCIGARNHRFFFIFCFWAMLFCAWTFSTLVGLNAHASHSRANFSIDGQHVAIIVISGFFLIFTTALDITHAVLIASNMTTLEQMATHRTKEREERVLGRLHSWWQFREKSATRKKWDLEWGRVGKEGHIWWRGSARSNWESTMGDKAWMWFLPIGHSPDDGLSYNPNPRFDAEGRWLPRKEWPAELR